MTMSDSRLATTDLGLEVEVTDTLESRGIIDASRVESQRPDIYRAAVRMLGYGIAVKTCAELLGIHRHTVLAIKDRAAAAGAIDPYKQGTVKRLRAIITLALDEMEHKAADGKISPIELCALIDKAELLSGGVTARTEVLEDPRAAEFRRLMQQAATAGPEMVTAGEREREKGRGREVVVDAEVVETGARDTESGGQDTQHVDTEEVDHGCK
jgi:hypothetical protein